MEVGANLCELDTEAEATVVSSNESAEPAAAAAAPPAPSAAPVVAVEAPKSARLPSIQFLGKDGWARKLSGMDAAVVYVPKNYGRPKFSEEEMEALMTGGANLVPEVKQLSAGAIFG